MDRYIREDFKSPELYDYLDNFCRDLHTDKLDKTKNIRDTRSLLIRHRNLLMSPFVDLSFQELTTDVISEIMQDASSYQTGISLTKDYHNLFVKLAQDGHLEYEIANRILSFKGSLIDSISNIRLAFILSDDAPMFMLDEELRNNKWKTLFFFDITSNSEFKYDSMKQAAINYCSYIKSIKDLKAGTRLNILRSFAKIVALDLCQYPVSDITFEFIQTHIDLPLYANSSSSKSEFIAFMKFVVWLNDSGLINSEKLEIYKNLELTFKSNDIALKVIHSDHIERYANCIINNTKRLYYLNVEDEPLRNVIKEFIEQKGIYDYIVRLFVETYEMICTGDTLDNLNFHSFKARIALTREKYPDEKRFLIMIVDFYSFIANHYNSHIFDDSGVSSSILMARGLGAKLYNGYELIPYNPIEKHPQFDKWILCYPKSTARNNDLNIGNYVMIDFSSVNNQFYKNCLKSYFWGTTISYEARRIATTHGIEFFNYIDDIHNGQVLTIFSKPIHSNEVRLEDIQAYVNYVRSYIDDPITQNHRIYGIRGILIYLSEEGLLKVPAGAYYYLTNKAPTKHEGSPIPKADLAKLSAYINNDKEHELLGLIFFLGLETELRISQITALTTDCLKETAKQNEFVVISKSKTSGLEELEFPITVYTKNHINRALALTKEIRKECQDQNLKEMLFLSRGSKKKNSFTFITAYNFNDYMKTVCEKLDLPYYKFSNIRDTHMTMADEYILRKGLSDLEKRTLTGHKSPKSDRYYEGDQIKNMLEAVHGIIIGDIDIAGNIISDASSVDSEDNVVSDGCGYCVSDCTDTTYLDCLMCKNFITTASRIPYFDERIKMLDDCIAKADIKHDKEDLITIKRLHVAYKEKLLNMQERMAN